MPPWLLIVLYVLAGIATARTLTVITRESGDAFGSFAIVIVWPVVVAIGLMLLLICAVHWLVTVGSR